MEETIVDRILKLFEEKQISNNEIVERIDISRSTLSQWKNGGRTAGLDIVMKLKNYWKNLNLDWLLLGQGTMEGQTDNSQSRNLFSNTHENDNKPDSYTSKNEPISPVETPQKLPTTENPKPEISPEKPPLIIEKLIIEKVIDKDKGKRIEKVIVYYNNGTFVEER